MNVAELSETLGISKPKAYELVRQDGFPVVYIGKRIVIPIDAFNNWLLAFQSCEKLIDFCITIPKPG